MPARIVSVNVGLPREVEWRGKVVRTSIFKSPVAGRVAVATLNLEGDRQSDLSVHGGKDKAVYAYPVEHYEFWRKELPGTELPWGAFGENLSVEGFLEDEVRIGDRFRAGSAEFIVTQPRMPCFKLGIRFNRPDIVKRFMHSGRTGFYFAVLREGEVGASDALERIAEGDGGVSVADIVALYATDAANQELLRRATRLAALPEMAGLFSGAPLGAGRMNTNTTFLLGLIAVVSGALIPVQAASNAALARAAGDNVPFAAVVLFLVATIAIALMMFASGKGLPALNELREAPWWSYSGGFIVGFYVLTITFLAPRLGVGNAIALVVTGQVLAAVTIDHFGLFRSLTVHLSATRLTGVALMAIGVFLALKR